MKVINYLYPETNLTRLGSQTLNEQYQKEGMFGNEPSLERKLEHFYQADMTHIPKITSERDERPFSKTC